MHARTALGFVVLATLAGTALADKPQRLFSESDDGSDPAPTIKKIKAELAAADNGKARLIVLGAATTDSWGCTCPPFVYAPFATAPADESVAYFYPIVKSGLDPDDHHVGSGGGTYEFTGKLTGERIDAATWYARRGKKVPKDASGPAFKKKQPVFAVESWCFRKNDDAPEWYGDQLAKMKKDGVPFCK